MEKSEISPEQQSYLDALESVENSAKFSVAATAGPLALIGSQIRTILSIDSLSLKILVTLVILIFLFAAFVSVLYLTMLRVVIAKEHLISRGVVSKGQKTLHFFEEILMKGGAKIDEDLLLMITRK